MGYRKKQNNDHILKNVLSNLSTYHIESNFFSYFLPKRTPLQQHELTGKSLMNRSYVIMNYTSRRLSDTFKQ